MMADVFFFFVRPFFFFFLIQLFTIIKLNVGRSTILTLILTPKKFVFPYNSSSFKLCRKKAGKCYY